MTYRNANEETIERLKETIQRQADTIKEMQLAKRDGTEARSKYNRHTLARAVLWFLVPIGGLMLLTSAGTLAYRFTTWLGWNEMVCVAMSVTAPFAAAIGIALAAAEIAQRKERMPK